MNIKFDSGASVDPILGPQGSYSHAEPSGLHTDDRMDNTSINTRYVWSGNRHITLTIFRGVVCCGVAAAGTSYVIVRASFAQICHSKQPFSFYWRPKSLALAREAYSGIGLFKMFTAMGVYRPCFEGMGNNTNNAGWVSLLPEAEFRAPKLCHPGAHDSTHLHPHVNASPAADVGN